MSSDLRWPSEATVPAAPAHSGVVCRRVTSAADRAEHHGIRRQVFVDEQAIFADSDLDAHDQDGSALAINGYCDGIAAGTVRLFVLDEASRLWQGDRLAVLDAYRLRGLGGPLVNAAVATAAVVGGSVMSAHIQPANVRFFQRLGWQLQGGREIYAGLVHQPMAIVLPDPVEASATLTRLAAGINVRDL
ncbi:MAG TPA: MSMEG_0567/Sll0786 family nitrogen starvation N-acetyltransferase [Nocardioidaceae bacterium]|nr:MSMEG_0567/Sll0786 family nitrogen starvation N-acetyltransferase [Nocardioidaceae bacterium]